MDYKVTIEGRFAANVMPEDIESALGAYFGGESGLSIEASYERWEK